MKAEIEIYRGIEFVRLSSLPKEQSKLIRESSFAKKTIKVLRGTDLLPDCLPYNAYLDWYNTSYPTPIQKSTTSEPTSLTEELKLSFK